ncbi:hypothetical protein [Streptomyces sp. OE57]|uniref:hypothetical protein n=1 Tax=Streptomyces lacaronensis TaxID=3379885 RepID=UPI0039B72B05
MTPRRRPPVPPPLPVITVYVLPGTPRPDWCHVCKAYTRVTGDVLLLTPAGVSVIGAYAGCEICDEPEEGERRG